MEREIREAKELLIKLKELFILMREDLKRFQTKVIIESAVRGNRF